jgi:hypothetical protein
MLCHRKWIGVRESGGTPGVSQRFLFRPASVSLNLADALSVDEPVANTRVVGK